jgi:hypothetical protein
MIVKYNEKVFQKSNPVYFKDLQVGDLFIYKNSKELFSSIYMKTDECCELDNTLVLYNKENFYFSGTKLRLPAKEEVIYLKAVLSIEEFVDKKDRFDILKQYD